jgi:S-formylglutathione hydrolase
MEKLADWKCFGGRQQVWRHPSVATGTPMTFGLFLPPGDGPHPLLWFLSGLTCTHANAMEKGQYQERAAALGLAVLTPDTSPRGEDVPDSPDYDLGQGAGFYLDATEAPWATHFRMARYVLDELPALVARFPIDPARSGVTGHSMGGHGALTLALGNPGRFRSISAFSPIVAPSRVPWGEKAFAAYLGTDRQAWRRHDAVALVEAGTRLPELKVDVGADDPFLDRELKPDLLEAACAAAGIPLTLERHPGYDHSYFFVATVMESHLDWHAARLLA